MNFAWKSTISIFMCVCILLGLLLAGCNSNDSTAEKSTWDDNPKNTYTNAPTPDSNEGAGDKNSASDNNEDETPILAEGITLSKDSLSIIIGETATLSATVSPNNATDKTITWTSSDENVATVTNGNVTAVGVGSAVIIATTSNGRTAMCTVTVTASVEDILAIGITLNKTTLSLTKGDITTLTATITPADVTDKTITWTSSDENIAVISNGTVTAVGVGTAVIIATTSNGKTATCTVTVDAPEVDILPTGIVLSNTALTITKGTTATLSATITPLNSTEKAITWLSSDESVATVSGGKITAVGKGTAAITASTANGKTAACIVTVEVKELAYRLSDDETYYIVTGMGNYIDAHLIIPDTYKNLPVKEIGPSAFSSRSNITSLSLGKNIETIGENAFDSCVEISNLVLPNSLKTIGTGAFSWCCGLTSITIPNSVTSIGEYAFSFCGGLTSITIPNSATIIGNLAFYGCSGLTSITVEIGNATYHSSGNCLIETRNKTLILGCKNSVIPSDGSVTSIGIGAFDGCSELTSITIPNSVTSIDEYAFSNCSGLTSVTISNSVTSIGEYAFYECSGLTSITIPNSVTSIGSYAFYECSGLTSITIPNSVTSIGKYAFYKCSGLTSITIGNGVTSIGYSAFDGCSGLTSITFKGTLEQWEAITKNIRVPATKVICSDGTILR